MNRDNSKEQVKAWVRHLVDNYYYLPYAPEVDLRRLPAKRRCNDLKCIEDNAVRILTEKSSEAEEYRQVIYNLAIHGYLEGLDVYALSRIGAVGIESIIGAREELGRINMLVETGRFRISVYKESVKLIANLVHLNFAYTPISLSYAIFTQVKSTKISTRPKAVFPTLQTTVLIYRTPIRAIDQSPMPEDVARLLVRFGLQLRCSVVEWILKRRPRRAGDIVAPIYIQMERELDNPDWAKARDLREAIRGILQTYVFREALLAPYYLYLYGYLELDPIMYLFMWELR